MSRFVEGRARGQQTLFPARLDDYIGEDNPVRVVDVYVDELDLAALGFERVRPLATGRPAYHPATLLKIYSMAISTASDQGMTSSLVKNPGRKNRLKKERNCGRS